WGQTQTCKQEISRLRSERQTEQLRGRAARNHDARRPKQSIFKTITAAGLANDRSFRKLLARFMCNRLVQVRVEFPIDCFDRLQSGQLPSKRRVCQLTRLIIPSRSQVYSSVWIRSRGFFSCLSDCDQGDVVNL